MQSSHVRHRRSLTVLVFIGCALFALGAAVSCADDVARVNPVAIAPRERASAPRPPADAAVDAPVAALPALDVAGRVTDDRDVAIVGRPLTILDRRGTRQEVLTDEEGGFWVGGVAPPYDVLVDAAPSGAVITPLVFFGLRRSDPRLEVFERQGPDAPPPASQALHLAVKLPPCRSVDRGCWVSVVTSSASGGGGSAGSFTAGAASAEYTVEHTFREPSLRAAEAVDVHVLVGDADYTEYAYAHLGQVPARPGETTELGTVEPLHVDTTEPATVAGHAEALPEGWEWTLSSQVLMPGGAAIGLRYDWSPSSAMKLPILPGATWQVAAWVQHPPTPESPYFHRSSQAWSGTLPLSTTNIALDVPAVPDSVRPTLEGALSRTGAGLAWDGHAPALASVVLVDLAHGQQRFRAFTAEAVVPLRRLEELGLRRLEIGEHVLDLTTTPGATVDELTDPDEGHRKERFGTQVAGGSTYQRFQLVVTP
jgi:hypothetical protein